MIVALLLFHTHRSISGLLWVIVSKTISRSTCANRAATIDFLDYLYTNPTAIQLAAREGFGLLPALLMDELNVLDAIHSDITCGGTTLAKEAEQLATVAGESGIINFMDMAVRYYDGYERSYSYQFIPKDATSAASQTMLDEIDAAFIQPDVELYGKQTDNLVGAVNDQQVTMLPAYLAAVVPTCTLPAEVIAPWVNADSNTLATLPALFPLKVDMETLALIFTGDIKQWTDKRLEALNPGLTAAFTSVNADTAITVVICCSDLTDEMAATNPFITALNTTAAFRTNGMRWSLPHPDWSQITRRAGNGNGTFIMDAVENRMPFTIQRTTGAIGYTIATSAARDPYTTISIINVNEDDGTKMVVSGSPTALAECAKLPLTGNGLNGYSLLSVIGVNAGSTGCWPIPLYYAFMVRRSYPISIADRANHTLSMVQWLLTTEMLNEGATVRGIYRLQNQPVVQKQVVASLHAVYAGTDSSNTLLITLPVYWSLSNGISIFGWFASSLGLVLMVSSMVVLVVCRSHVVIRSASWPFMMTILCGLSMVFIAVIFIVTTPTAGTCGLAVWTAFVGFTLTFAPVSSSSSHNTMNSINSHLLIIIDKHTITL